MNSSATIRDVAREAKVAVSTASSALNSKPYVSEKTRFRVIKAAEELDYHPHSMARNLACGRTKNVGLISPIPIETVFSSGFFLQLIKGVIENITGQNSKKTKILVPADLIIRESS